MSRNVLVLRKREPRRTNSGLNGVGQIAYQFMLADGRQGVAITTVVPEPGALALAGLAVLGLIGIARRRHCYLLD